jgi:hypothetical protein
VRRLAAEVQATRAGLNGAMMPLGGEGDQPTQLRHQVISTFRPAVFDRNALPSNVAGFTQTLPKGGHTVSGGFASPSTHSAGSNPTTGRLEGGYRGTICVRNT